jgi:hypothetical protein
MLTDPKLRAQVDALWDKFWTGGLSNPLDAIEQFSYFLFTVPKAFIRRLDLSTQAFGTFFRSNLA